MTAVTTMEQFTALPEGTQVTVSQPSGSSNWVKGGSGWKSGQFLVQDRHFRPAIDNGNVALGSKFASGQVWSLGLGLYYMLLAHDEESGRWTCAELQRRTRSTPTFNRLIELEPRHMDQWNGPVDLETATWPGLVMSMSSEMLEQRRARQRLDQQVADLYREADEFRDKAQHRLVQWAQVAGHDEDMSFAAVLDDLGMDRPEVSVTVDVTVYGTMSVTITDPPEGLVPESVELVGPIRAETPFKVQLPLPVTVPVGNCACEELGSEDVYRLLNDNDIAYEDVEDFEFSCSNCS